MSLDEKIFQLSGNLTPLGMVEMLIRYNRRPFSAGGCKRLGIPPVKFTDGPRGVALGRSTCFPVSMARGASWDSELEERVGEVMGIEARTQGANLSGAVCINLLRHPSWGRAQETYGEDPYHLGMMGSALARGIQKHIMACAKHFAGNSIENSRFYVNVEIEERTLREVYLPHFKKCVDEGIASIMSAYNRLNGKYCSENPHLLREILKQDWGFKGFVISDFLWAVHDTKSAILASLDIEMPRTKYYGAKLKSLVKNGEVEMELIDDALQRIFRQLIKFAQKDGSGIYQKSRVACEEHTQLALEVARKSIVLLKNENSFLPLEREQIRKIAVIGRLAEMPNLGDKGSSRVYPPYVITPLEGIKEKAGKNVQVFYDSGKNLSRARALAGKVDVVVVVAGFTSKEEGEFIPIINRGGDRINLSLPPEQEELIKAVAGENPNCIVVIETGSAVIMESWKELVKAILIVWYPGMEGGRALGEILFGEVNPSGRLPLSFPASHQHLPEFNNRTKRIKYDYFHGYWLLDKKGFQPAYPFGYGLSYTQFHYHQLRLNKKELEAGENLTIELELENTGKLAGEEVVQLYIGFPGSRIERPLKGLKGFSRVALQPGERKSVILEFNPMELAYYDSERGEWKLEENNYQILVGSSSRQIYLKDEFRLKI